MNKVPAWILPITDTMAIAVGEFELVHILPESPRCFEVPQAPPYCRWVLLWQDRIVPVMDLAARFRCAARDAQPMPGKTAATIGICAYRAEGTDPLEYGALRLHAIPRRCEVSDAQARRLPETFASWRRYVSSGFQAEGSDQVIPIVRLERLFSP